MLKLRRIGIDTYHENVAFLRRDCTIYRAEEFKVLNRIELVGADAAGTRHSIRATLNLVEPDGLIECSEIGLSDAAYRQFGLPEGADVALNIASPPPSHEALRRKVVGRALSAEDYRLLVGDIVAGRYSKLEIAAFVAATAHSLSAEEVLHLTRAMIETGTRLDWGPHKRMVVDKHSIGGIPGNRTSMIVVPIVAAHGLTIPKTSSRAITSPAGTADTMEVLARVDLDLPQMREVVEAENACLVWGGHVNLSPADDIFIAIERPLGIDTREQMVASIVSKKVAAGVTHMVLDVPVGPTAKVRTGQEATDLRKLFEHVADALGLTIDIVFTDGSQPIGPGIGPVLEARDVMAVLCNQRGAPADLRDKALLLAGHVLEFDPALRGGRGLERARDLLLGGQALAHMERIIERQGRQSQQFARGALVAEIAAPANGTIAAIDCFRLARIARLAGAPIDKGAGIDILCMRDQAVRAGQPLYRIHAGLQANFGFARDFAAAGNGYRIEAS